MDKIIFIGGFVASLLLYYFAPEKYSFSFTAILFIIYLLISVRFIGLVTFKNYFNFYLLFLFSFLFVNFIYPVFIFPIDPVYFPVYNHSFNENIISKSTALALLGISSFLLGGYIRKLSYKTKTAKEYFMKENRIVNVLLILSVLLMIIFLVQVGVDIYSGLFGSTTETSPFYLTMFQVIFQLAIILEFRRNRNKFKGSTRNLFKYFKKSLLFIILLYSFIFLYVGDRGPIIQLILILIVLYTYFIKKLKLQYVIVVIILGMFVATFISYARTTDVFVIKRGNTLVEYLNRGSEQMQVNAFYDVGMELIVNNRNLYVGYDLANKKGFEYGKTMFPAFFSVFPMLPTYMSEWFFESLPSELSSGWIITVDTLGQNATWGLGTNVIIDIYMNFGSIGVILLMFILGVFIMHAYLSYEGHSNFYFFLIYVILVSFSLYYPRAGYFAPIRHILWTILAYYFITKLSNVSIITQSKKAS